jgi:hypothetical protein
MSGDAWEEMRNTYMGLIGKPEGKRQLGGNGCKWEDNIKMDLKEVRWECVDRIFLDPNVNQWRFL